jgi:RimJ/RimL family protein N-acetyltransferase
VTSAQPSHPPLPELRTARLALRPLVEADAEALLQICSDPRVVRFADNHLDSMEAALACIHQYAESYRQGVGLRWGIHGAPEGKLIGTIGFQSLFLTRAEVAFELAAEVWNQGLEPGTRFRSPGCGAPLRDGDPEIPPDPGLDPP